VYAGIVLTVVHIHLTVISRVTRSTYTGVVIIATYAGGVILTGVDVTNVSNLFIAGVAIET
jgi:hypothetical protein